MEAEGSRGVAVSTEPSMETGDEVGEVVVAMFTFNVLCLCFYVVHDTMLHTN